MIWLPSRSGRIDGELLLLREPRDPRPRGRRRCGAAARPCAGCGSCSRRGSARAAARAGRRRRGRSGVRRSRSTRRRRSRGSAGAARPAWPPRRSSSLENRSACIRLRVILAPTTSWWWKVTDAVVEEPAGPRLADVVHQRGEPGDEVRAAAGQPVLEVDRLLEHGERVLVDVLVPVVLVALERERRQLGQHAARRARSRRAASARSRGYGAQTSLTSSSRTRSAEMISIRPAIAVIAATTSGATVKPSWAANRAARIIRSGSSEKESSRPCPACAAPAARGRPRRRTGPRRLAAGQPHRHRVHGEVAAAEVALEACRRSRRPACARPGRRPRSGTS